MITPAKDFINSLLNQISERGLQRKDANLSNEEEMVDNIAIRDGLRELADIINDQIEEDQDEQ